MKYSIGFTAFIISLSALGAEWDYPAGNAVVASQQEAKAYLEQMYSEVGSFRFRYQTESKLGEHYNFDVIVAGEYQHQQSMVVSTDHDGRVTRTFKSLKDTVLRNGEPTKAAELEAPRQLEARLPPSLNSGEAVSILTHVFSPDLRTMDRQEKPSSLMTEVTQYPNLPQYETESVMLLKSGDLFYLSNERVSQVDAQALVTVDPLTNEEISRDSHAFLESEGVTTFSSIAEINDLTWEDKRFVQMMAFHHLDQSVQYIQNLGFTLFTQPIQFDGRGLSADNSTYYYGPKAIIFGIGGGSPDAFDADVVLHELGHGIHYQIVRDWAYGHSGAIGEGFGDYWAGSFSYRTQYENTQTRGQEFEIDTVFNWDGFFGVRETTRSLWNQRARYFEHAEYRAHENVAGELGDELWSTPLFQSLKASVNRYGGMAFEEFDTIVLESMFGLGRGFKMDDLAQNMLYVAKELYPQRDYVQILSNNFAVHGLVIAPFKLELASQYVHPEQPLSIDIYPTSRQAKVNGQLTIDGEASEFVSDKFKKLNVSTPLPKGKICGQSIAMQSTIDYQYSALLQTQQWSQEANIVYGIPVLGSDIKSLNSHLPDMKQSSSNQPIVGFKVFNYTLADKSRVIDDQFGVFIDIDHTKLSDLIVTLTSPQGTRITLLDHKSTTFNGFTGYFTAQHDEAMAKLKGEPSWGTWRLEIADYVSGNSGLLKRWAVGAIDHYECGDAAIKPTEPESGSSSGGTPSYFSLLFLMYLTFLRWIKTCNTSRVIQALNTHQRR